MDPFRSLAEERGWGYRRTILPHRDTPFLHLGEDADAGPCFTVEVAGCQAEIYEHARVSGTGTARRVDATYVVLRLLDPVHLAGIDQLRLMPRSTAYAAGAAANDRRVVELESVELEQAFFLEAGRGTDDTALHRLFTPALISELLDLAAAKECYLGEYLDYAWGRVMLASGGTIAPSDGPALEATLVRVAPLLRELLRSTA